jgi:hypothetical protein
MTAHKKGLSYFLLRRKSGGAICQVRDGWINCRYYEKVYTGHGNITFSLVCHDCDDEPAH